MGPNVADCCRKNPVLTGRIDHIKNGNSETTLYAKGLSPRDIVEVFQEMDDADVSAALISQVTDKVSEPMTQWQ